MKNDEQLRLKQAAEGTELWKKWGPYLSERQWGTVREDYSENGDAWNFFTHDHARYRAYRWGEDGIAGISDDQQLLCFALALWNGKDPILKERIFGLTNSEGNHGEDVKEYYFYLDSSPTHSYMKYLYKYPHAAFPYEALINVNRQRSREEMEYELIDTGVFNDNRYFDVFVEYAKEGPDDVLIKITAINRGGEAADLQVLPTLWFRNDWSEWISANNRAATKPKISKEKSIKSISVMKATHTRLGNYFMYCEGDAQLLFTENETNHQKLFGNVANESPYVKDGINDYVTLGRINAVNPDEFGTKASAFYKLQIAGGESATLKLRLVKADKSASYQAVMGDFDAIFKSRIAENDEFYQSITPAGISADEADIMRQALAGMLWSKQFFFFDGDNWLDEHHSNPLHSGYKNSRNSEWFHLLNKDIISMPDKWEYPWYAAWDLAFHTLPLALVDPDFAREQLALMLRGAYLHPSGQIPAYEWNFSDVNPPVHAWATLFLYRTAVGADYEVNHEFIKSAFNKLLLNFTWWVNRKDRFGKNVFEGGFLGLDNIGVFDRSAPLPTGGYLEQADGTAWMALFSQNMLELAIEIAAKDKTYTNMVVKFAEHFCYIAVGMNKPGKDGMWDEEDGFYYDLLRMPDGSSHRLKVRSMVGLLPLCATTIIEEWQKESMPDVLAQINERMRRIPELKQSIHPTGEGNLGFGNRSIMALLTPEKLRRILEKMLDENEFLSPYGIRSLSRYHQENPYVFHAGGQEYRVDYLPAESNTGMFGGNSNWRGPVWMPVNALIVRALLNFYLYYGDSFKVECPTGSGNLMNLFEVSEEISRRLTAIFTRNEEGKRPVYGGTQTFQEDEHWKDYISFYEYFHGDNGAGLGASHQTGWTGLVAKLIHLYGNIDAETLLNFGKRSVFKKSEA